MSNQWFVKIDGKAQGPLNELQIRKLMKMGRIEPDTEVRPESGGAWMTAAEAIQILDQGTNTIDPIEALIDNVLGTSTPTPPTTLSDQDFSQNSPSDSETPAKKASVTPPIPQVPTASVPQPVRNQLPKWSGIAKDDVPKYGELETYGWLSAILGVLIMVSSIMISFAEANNERATQGSVFVILLFGFLQAVAFLTASALIRGFRHGLQDLRKITICAEHTAKRA
ncbi:hypothetical protein Plim_1216 [Planctopirus limnophila DSM 3776]|uniref:GYF domain-containing protein n=1 Tax=Planctopirus limnophila (strain ATCC 43296 / DSM 3776 / IFAM 1008 / Mu 290) TaxID=521674 RepID=D5SUJ9_PLAL2|nr:DUF4339 domain-containing protein [Planctopirus limnophila]ADG67051.1 hypothetical protein Plim_1216 [Planctopirus limnophila DSM 3776]